MLMPAAVLIVIVLAAIAVDFAVTFLAERELANVTAAAANDAAGQALDEAVFHSTGEVRLDPAVARSVVTSSMATRHLEYVDGLEWDVDVAPSGQVTVVARGTVGTIFSKAIPGGPARATVEARSQARAIER